MKVKVDTDYKDFQPVTLTVTIESKTELYELWHRMNGGGCHFEAYEMARCHEGEPPLNRSEWGGYVLWDALDEVWKSTR